MQANAGKTGGTIESLLIKHAKLDKTPAELARLLSSPRKNSIAILFEQEYEWMITRQNIRELLPPLGLL
jgi:hypothetical protein